MYYVLIHDYHLKISLGNQHVDYTEDTDQHVLVYVFKFKVSISAAFIFQKCNVSLITEDTRVYNKCLLVYHFDRFTTNTILCKFGARFLYPDCTTSTSSLLQ